MNKELKVCEVCKLLDNDYTAKECSYCKICSSWICNMDLNNYMRRRQAFKKHFKDTITATVAKILVVVSLISLVGCILSRDYSKTAEPSTVRKLAPLNYSARTDKVITQLPSPLPQWNSIG